MLRDGLGATENHIGNEKHDIGDDDVRHNDRLFQDGAIPSGILSE